MNKIIVTTYLLSLALYQHDTHVLISLSELFSLITLFLCLRVGLIFESKTIKFLLILFLLLFLSIGLNIDAQNRYTLFLNAKHWLHLLITIVCFNTFYKAISKTSSSNILMILSIGLVYHLCCYGLYNLDVNVYNALFKTDASPGLERFHYLTPNVFLLFIILRSNNTMWGSFVLLVLVAIYFLLTQSRQSLAILILVMFKTNVMTYLRGRRLIVAFGVLGVAWSGLLSWIINIASYFGIGEGHIYRISEIQNLFISKSFWVRSFDAVYVFNDVISSGYVKIAFGLGLGKIFNIPRPGVSYGDIAKEVKPLDYIHEFITHSPDFLLSVLLIDGGLVLVFMAVSIYFKEVLMRKTTLEFKIFVSIYLLLLVGSTHLLYNSIYLFIILYLNKAHCGQKTSVLY